MANKVVNILIKAKDETAAGINSALGGLKRLVASPAALIGGAVGGLSVGAIIKESLEGFAEAEAASVKLSTALDLLGKGGKSATDDMKAFAEEIMRQTTLDDDAVVSLAALGASMGKLSGEQLKQATVAAIGFSRALNIDVESAMTLVSKAAQGHAEAFGRYGISFDKNATDQEKFNQILLRGADAFKLARAETETLSGKLAQAKVALGNVGETIGSFLAPVVISLADTVRNSMPTIESYIRSFAESAIKSITFVETVFRNWGDSLEYVRTLVALNMTTIWKEIEHVFSVNVPQLLTWFGNNWQNLFADLLDGTVAAFMNLGENIKVIWTELWDYVSTFGAEGFEEGWSNQLKAMFDGFSAATEQLPDFIARSISEEEQELERQLGELGANIGDKFNAKLAERMKLFGLNPGGAGGGVAGEGGGGVAGVIGGSTASGVAAAAFRAFGNGSGGIDRVTERHREQVNIQKQMLKGQERQTAALEKIQRFIEQWPQFVATDAEALV